jgi:DNA-3-methyladenine glycosylase
MRPLPRSFYSRNTVSVAKDLIGKTLVRKINGTTIGGIISETEAYTTNDPASHAFKGLTKRNAPMFGEVGHAYVYFIYGNHHCLNVTARSGQRAGAVLIRGIAGVNGPGRLTKMMGIDRTFNWKDMTVDGNLFVSEGEKLRIMRTPRIGISSAREKKWRFVAES